jgi:coproporphyrinogen III oxidase-like Fe-S oxidoreductase
LGHDYLGLGVGAVSTVDGLRWRNLPALPRYLAALASYEAPPREVESLAASTRTQERLMLGLRLDDPLPFAQVQAALDLDALARLEGLGLVERQGDALLLTRRGRFLGGGVTAELIAEIPANNYN